MESFGTYIDHLILLLAARFQAPLEASTEEVLSTGNESAEKDPWELVSRTVQRSLCGPLTEQERAYMHHLDVHHFTASVCRERARYAQWKLRQDKKCSRADRRSAQTLTGASSAANPTAVKTTANAATTSVDPSLSTFDITRDSLRREVSALYALVSQSLPSTLDSDDEDVGSDEENASATAVASAIPTTATAVSPPLSAQVHEVFVRTREERHRDEQAARARDEFLSQIQALQSMYFEKYRRWMEVPENVLEPPPPTQRAAATSSALSSRQSSVSVNGGEAAAQKSMKGFSQLSKHSEEDERTALLDALRLTRTERPAPQSVPFTSTSLPSAGIGAHPTIAAMRRQVRLERPLRPSAVSGDALDDSYHASADSQAMRKSTGYTGAAEKNAVKSAASSVVARAAVAESGAADKKPSAVPISAALKETAPPASRRGRWQILEYNDEDERDE